MKILLAEDNQINQELIQDYLEETGFDILIAENGMQATRLFASHRFDVILMDCHMPIMDGFEATQTIRELEQRNQLSRIPIIAVTAHAMQHEQDRCFVCGMDDYLSKPFSRADLLGKLRKWCNQPAVG
jgi:CheY-like chemotaxis protein